MRTFATKFLAAGYGQKLTEGRYEANVVRSCVQVCAQSFKSGPVLLAQEITKFGARLTTKKGLFYLLLRGKRRRPPAFSYPCDLVHRLWRTFLGDNDDSAHISRKHVRKVPEMVRGEFLKQACARTCGIRPCPYWIGSHHATPSGGTYNLEGQV